jgi:hypothetical protein
MLKDVKDLSLLSQKDILKKIEELKQSRKRFMTRKGHAKNKKEITILIMKVEEIDDNLLLLEEENKKYIKFVEDFLEETTKNN